MFTAPRRFNAKLFYLKEVKHREDTGEKVFIVRHFLQKQSHKSFLSRGKKKHLVV